MLVAGEQIHIVYQAILVGILGGFLNLIFSTVLLWKVAPRAPLLGWSAAVFVVAMVRFLLGRAYQRIRPDPEDAAPWGRRLRWVTLVSGAVWGAGFLMLPTGFGSVNTTLYFICLMGVIWGSVLVYGAVPGLYRAFVLPIYLPMILWALVPLEVSGFLAATVFFLIVSRYTSSGSAAIALQIRATPGV